MDTLYMWLNIGSISLPLLFSFHPKLQLYKRWKYLFPSIAIMMLLFISWDIIFVKYEIWGFNSSYFLGITIINLPLEEWLFFICIPYACVFTHYSLVYFFPKMELSKKTTSVVYVLLLTLLILLSFWFYDRWYSIVNFTYAILLLGLTYNFQKEVLQKFFLTFLVMLVPFFLVNGTLTGSFIEEPVVWYNNAENMGLRLLTIPVEDTFYAFTMILTCILLLEFFERRFSKVL
ncbi:MAG: lycopene cyclase domain-containing protein [Bacteroidetes bacterium HGW-Bacteroidetes-2]|nr:MAG: lycopene cyclase domain-containing protein [Bacteroidetes bacterium HGW-Bacteroidetes-2]